MADLHCFFGHAFMRFIEYEDFSKIERETEGTYKWAQTNILMSTEEKLPITSFLLAGL